jgi:hypothetical protein
VIPIRGRVLVLRVVLICPLTEAEGVRRAICDMSLLIFHLVLSAFTFEGVDVRKAARVLEWNLKRYPNGARSILLCPACTLTPTDTEQASSSYSVQAALPLSVHNPQKHLPTTHVLPKLKHSIGIYTISRGGRVRSLVWGFGGGFLIFIVSGSGFSVRIYVFFKDTNSGVLQSCGKQIVVGETWRRGYGGFLFPSFVFVLICLRFSRRLISVHLVVQSNIHIRRSSMPSHARRARRSEEAHGARPGAKAENRGEEHSCRGAFLFPS